MKKGFVHVVEAVLVSLIAIVAILYLFYPSNPEIDWGRTDLTVTGEDLLTVSEGYLKDIMEKRPGEIDDKFSNMLSHRRISFNIKSVGAYKNEIRVGCNCSRDETEKLKGLLSPAYVNNRKINFVVFPFNFENLTGEKYLDYDVIVLNSKDQVDRAGNSLSKVKASLYRGNGIVEFVDLDNIDDLQTQVFGLESSGSTDPNDIEFVNRNDPEKPNYEIGKLFYGTDSSVNVTGGSSEKTGEWVIWNIDHDVRTKKSGGSFDTVDVSNDTDPDYEYRNLQEGDEFNIKHDGAQYNFSVEKISEERVWFNHLEGYKFENSNNEIISSSERKVGPIDGPNKVVAETDGGQASVIMNESKGRAVWVSKARGDDIQGLLKASVIWAAGKDWWNLLRTTANERVKVEKFVSQGEEIYEPYKVEMTLWYMY